MRLILLLLLVALHLSLSANDSRQFRTTEITTLDGLPHNGVSEMIQDSVGFIWAATYDGLCRYDGYDCVTYCSGDMGLNANLIISLAEDRSGNIWVGTTNKGLFYFVRAENRFVNFSDMVESTVVEMISPRRLAVAADGALWCYDSILKQIVRIEYDSTALKVESARYYSSEDEDFHIVSALTATNSDIFIGTRSGIYRYDSDVDGFVVVDSDRLITGARSITQRDDLLFIACYSDLLSLNLNSGEVIVHKVFPSSLFVYCWVNDTIWITSRRGVFVSKYASYTNKFSDFVEVEEYDDRTPKSIIKDHANGVWVAYSNQGITRYEQNNTPFRFNQWRGLKEYAAQTMYVDNRNELYVGCMRNGLEAMSGVNGEIRSVGVLPPKSNVLSIAQKGDKIFVAVARSVYIIEGDNQPHTELLMSKTSIRKLLIDNDYLWLATYGDGIIRYDLNSGSTLNISANQQNTLPSNIIRNLMIDSRGVLWVTTSHGVAYILDRDGDNPTVRTIECEQNPYSMAIVEDCRGDVWVGTIGDGLYRLRYDTTYVSSYRMDRFTKIDGLESNIINAIEEDDRGGLWLSTSKGLSWLMVQESGVKIKNFDGDDGVMISYFSELSSAKLSDGTIIFGGVGGFVYFKPDLFLEDLYSITPVITDFKIDGESIFSDVITDGLIEGRIDDEKGVTLHHNQNNIAIKFAGLHFSAPSKYQYQYILSGVDQRWRTTTASAREVNYSNLKPGRYIFCLKVASRDGKWSETPLTLPIIIEFPIWQRWYAFIIYAAVLLLVGFYVIKYYHDLRERRKAISQMRFEREKISEMLDLRTRFFTNVSHEFRTPLTLILSPMQRLMDDERIKSNGEWSELFSTMSHNGESLMRLVNEFLNYTKQESGELLVQLSSGDIVAHVKSLFSQFKYHADLRSLTLKFVAPKESVTLLFDPYLIEQVIYNLTSNAIKHTSAGGVVELSIENGADSVTISVKDNGCGIPVELQPNIFKQYFSRSSDSSKALGGTGIGLFLTQKIVELHGGNVWFESQLGEGSKFFVEIPRRVNESVPVVDSTTFELVPESTADKITNVIDDENLPTLLVVDDSVEIVTLLKSLFANRYRVLSAADGVEGVEAAMAETPDIIISDVMMPRMDGVEMCEQLKNNIATSHIPIIMLSAKSSTDDIVAGLRATADGYCPKPFNNRVLMALVDATFENRKRLAARITTVATTEELDTPPSFVDLCDSATTNLDKQFLAKLTKFIEDNLDNSELSTVEVCDQMGLSPFIVNKKLKSLLNMTIIVFMRTVRIRRAAELLKSSRNSIADVTYDVGFSDLKYFRRCFKEEFGITPQEYKDKYSES